MAERNFEDWLPAYLKYASVTEAPLKMHTWAAIGAMAGALRRRVWIDMKRFVWSPSFYIMFVARPGIVAKSTTFDIAMDLLRAVPGIKFGPNAATWQSLVTAFAGAAEAFEWPQGSGDWHTMSPITLVSSELGSLLNLQDREMVALLIELWDGKKRYEKITKMSGNDTIEMPWINIEAATTPNWLEENASDSVAGGGLFSRFIILFADKKDKYVPYVDETVNSTDMGYRAKLIQDLEYMSVNLCGPFTISPEARDWGREWYVHFWETTAARMDDRLLDAYAARKQTHLHKTAMVLSASRSDDLIIEARDLQLANCLLEDLERDMPKVFAKIGRTEDNQAVDRFIEILRRKGRIPYQDIYLVAYQHFPRQQDMDAVVHGALKAGVLKLVNVDNAVFIEVRNDTGETRG